MQWFKNLKLFNKLLLSFLVCSIMTLAVGAYSLTRILDLRDVVRVTYEDNLRSIQLLGQAAQRLAGDRDGQSLVFGRKPMAGRGGIERLRAAQHGIEHHERGTARGNSVRTWHRTPMAPNAGT